MTKGASYGPPERPVTLSGPVSPPEPGTLPIRGDLAHIALAHRYLSPAYVVPLQRRVGEIKAAMHLTASSDSEVLEHLKPGQEVEMLDQSGDWCWVCLGSEGPSGYVLAEALLTGTV